jgi:hypothetical protein
MILKSSKKLKFIFCWSPLFVSTRSWSKPPVFILEFTFIWKPLYLDQTSDKMQSQQIPIIKETLFRCHGQAFLSRVEHIFTTQLKWTICTVFSGDCWCSFLLLHLAMTIQTMVLDKSGPPLFPRAWSLGQWAPARSAANMTCWGRSAEYARASDAEPMHISRDM